jgi:hypothetical protein
MEPNYYDSAGFGAYSTTFWIGYFSFLAVIAAFFIICQWKIFTKAGQPGWASIVPIYGFLVFMKIIGKPWWWLLLFFVPFVGFLFAIYFIIAGTHALSKSFGKDTGFTVGLILLSFIFYPILAFDKSIVYVGPGGVPNLDDQVDMIGTKSAI